MNPRNANTRRKTFADARDGQMGPTGTRSEVTRYRRESECLELARAPSHPRPLFGTTSGTVAARVVPPTFLGNGNPDAVPSASSQVHDGSEFGHEDVEEIWRTSRPNASGANCSTIVLRERVFCAYGDSRTFTPIREPLGPTGGL